MAGPKKYPGGIVDYPVKVGPGDTRYVKAKVGPNGEVKILLPKRPRIAPSAPIVNVTTPNPKILKQVAQASRTFVLKAAKSGDPEPYVYGYTAVRPLVIAADDSDAYLVLDLLWSAGRIEEIEGGPYLYLPDYGTVDVSTGSPFLHEHFLGTSTQTASTIMTSLKGSYDTLASKAHSVVSMQQGWNLNIMGFIKGRWITDPRASPQVAYSTNPALILADVLTLCGYTMDWTSVATAADYCDELVDSPGEKRWEIGGVIRDRNDLRYWVHTLAQYANCFVDIQGGTASLVPDTPRASSHTVTADDMIEGTVRVTRAGGRNIPDAVTVVFNSYIDRTFNTTYGTSGGSGTVTQLDMPLWKDFNRAQRKAQEVYNKARADLTLEYASFDDGLLRTVGDVGTITNAAYGLSAQTMTLIENEQIDRGRWRRTYVEYDPTVYVETNAGGSSNTTTLNGPYNPPNGPTPTLTYVGFGAASPQTDSCIKIEFTGLRWPYLKDYYVTVTTTADLSTILYSEYVTDLGATLHTTYTDFAAAIGSSPQTTYRVKVYVRSIVSTDIYDVLSTTPGTADITDPVAVYWNTNPLATFDLQEYAGTATPSILFSGTDATTGTSSWRWDYSAQAKIIEPLIAGTFGNNEYVVMYDNVVEIYGNDSNVLLQINGTTNPSIWFDALGAEVRILDQSANSPQLKGQVYSCDIHFAQDDGAGGPLAGTIITKPVTLIAWGAENWYYDLFTDTNGTLLQNHTPTDPAAVSPSGWEILAGSFEISSNRAISSGASPLVTASACIDMGDTDVAWRGYVLVSGSTGDDVALIGRVQDASNYWQLKLTDTDTANPVLTLNEVSGGTPTSRATVTMTGKGPLSDSTTQLMRLTFSGNSILGAICIRGTGDTQYISDGTSPDAVWTVSYTSASFNTQTRFGIQCFQDNASWDSVYGSMVEPDYLAYIDNYVQGP